VDNWEVALMKIIRSLGGRTDTQSIYGELEEGTFITLAKEHLQKTVYGGRPAYQHSTRSYLSNLTKAGYLQRESRATYVLTKSEAKRIEKTP
jgi:hypothetical protein